jgi:hypothetical protein
MNKIKVLVANLVVLMMIVTLSGCKPQPFSDQDITQSRQILEEVLNAFATEDTQTLKKDFVPTATKLTESVGDIMQVWLGTLNSIGVKTASISGYQIDTFQVLKNEPDRLTASVLYTGTYTFTTTTIQETYFCKHQIQVVFVKYQGKILVANLQQQGTAPSCTEVKR